MANPFDDYLESSINTVTTTGADEEARDKELYARIPFYPNQGYIEKNWKPEYYDREAIAQLARAQALAEKQNILSPELGKYFFPTQLIERRPNNFGINDPLVVKGTVDPYKERAQKMRLSPPVLETNSYIANRLGGKPGVPISVYATQPGGAANNITEYNLWGDENARFAALFFADKGINKTTRQAVEAWNGKGQVKREGVVVADSKNHLAKVEEMLRMLDHPSNAEIKKVWQYYYGQALKEK